MRYELRPRDLRSWSCLCRSFETLGACRVFKVELDRRRCSGSAVTALKICRHCAEQRMSLWGDGTPWCFVGVSTSFTADTLQVREPCLP